MYILLSSRRNERLQNEEMARDGGCRWNGRNTALNQV